MPSKDPGSIQHEESPCDSDAGRHAAGARALTEAARAWSTLVDGWWRQQSAMLPPELERAMTSTLDQSKALVDMACAQAARAAAGSSAAADSSQAQGAEDSSAAGDLGLWKPVIDACREFEADSVGSTADPDKPGSSAEREFRHASWAYLNEFVQINLDVVERLQRRIAASPPEDFRQLHALVVEEAENAYMDRVSGDAFAKRQAAYVNAMFKLRLETTKTKAP